MATRPSISKSLGGLWNKVATSVLGPNSPGNTENAVKAVVSSTQQTKKAAAAARQERRAEKKQQEAAAAAGATTTTTSSPVTQEQKNESSSSTAPTLSTQSTVKDGETASSKSSATEKPTLASLMIRKPLKSQVSSGETQPVVESQFAAPRARAARTMRKIEAAAAKAAEAKRLAGVTETVNNDKWPFALFVSGGPSVEKRTYTPSWLLVKSEADTEVVVACGAAKKQTAGTSEEAEMNALIEALKFVQSQPQDKRAEMKDTRIYLESSHLRKRLTNSTKLSSTSSERLIQPLSSLESLLRFPFEKRTLKCVQAKMDDPASLERLNLEKFAANQTKRAEEWVNLIARRRHIVHIPKNASEVNHVLKNLAGLSKEEKSVAVKFASPKGPASWETIESLLKAEGLDERVKKEESPKAASSTVASG